VSPVVSVDFVDPESGVAGIARVTWSRDGAPASALGVLLAGEASWRSSDPDDVRVEEDGERARASLAGDGAGFEIEATRTAGASFEAGTAFADASGVEHELFAIRVTGGWRAGDSTGRLDCPGTLVRATGAVDWSRVELVRSLGAVLDDGALLGVAAARPRDAAGHGDEAASAVLLDAEGSLTRFDEPLVSTEYDPDGRPRRVGVELWGSDDEAAPVRGAGTLIGPAADVALLRFTLDGTPGTARYELLTPTG
jgi:hypothetical protein